MPKPLSVRTPPDQGDVLSRQILSMDTGHIRAGSVGEAACGHRAGTVNHHKASPHDASPPNATSVMAAKKKMNIMPMNAKEETGAPANSWYQASPHTTATTGADCPSAYERA
mmetsp:Transcript_16460/g.42511  ORF Transcript_16460/g.42511 Transcript_16460/m.42511 type:complete len:112 (+) Transcript_16460:130-465(+)